MDASPSPAAGEVISLRSHAAYRPDFKALASGQIAAARAKLGLTHAEFAEYLSEQLGWVPAAAVVKRWEEGSIPPGDAVLAAAVISQDVPGDVLTLPLSPEAERRAGLLSAIGPALNYDDAESVTSYANRGLITRQQWNGIIREATCELWLYGMAEFGYASDDEVPGILSEAAANGCQARILLLNPEYPSTTAIDRDEGHPAGTLTARIRASLAQFSQIRGACGKQVQLRTYDGHPTVSVVRGDDRMFVTPYLRFIMGSNSPTFELRSQLAAKMFSRYARHFENTWNLAREWAG